MKTVLYKFKMYLKKLSTIQLNLLQSIGQSDIIYVVKL